MTDTLFDVTASLPLVDSCSPRSTERQWTTCEVLTSKLLLHKVLVPATPDSLELPMAPVLILSLKVDGQLVIASFLPGLMFKEFGCEKSVLLNGIHDATTDWVTILVGFKVSVWFDEFMHLLLVSISNVSCDVPVWHMLVWKLITSLEELEGEQLLDCSEAGVLIALN